jgi:hypothetical protein
MTPPEQQTSRTSATSTGNVFPKRCHPWSHGGTYVNIVTHEVAQKPAQRRNFALPK